MKYNNIGLNKGSARLCSVLLVALLFSACAGHDVMKPERVVTERPGWIELLPERSGHEYGVGSADVYSGEADAIEQAKERARADLIRQIQVTVSSEFSSQSDLNMVDGQRNSFVEQVNEKISSRIPDVELPGLSWQAQWQDPKSGTFYVLAHLNRRAAEQQLSERLSLLDIDLADAQLPDQGNRFQRVQQALPLLSQFAQRDKLVQQLSFIAESGFVRFQLDDELKSLRQSLNRLVASLRIELVPKNQQAKQLATGLAEGLSQLGLVLSDQSLKKPDLSLNYSLRLTDKTVSGTYYVFAHTQLQVRNQDNQILKGFEREAKGVSGFPERAQQAAIQRLAKILAENVVATLFSQ
jgi:hypothetical protein